MKIIGIPLRRPNYTEVTAAAVMGVGLWLAGLGLMVAAGLAPERADAGALLLVAVWGCLSVRLGIRIEMGSRHLLAHLLVTGLLLAMYESARAIAV